MNRQGRHYMQSATETATLLLTPQQAADVLGITRQALTKKRGRLDASGQALMVDGHWRIRGAGLWRWWITCTRTGPVWERLVRSQRILGKNPEAMLVELGGLEKVASFAVFLEMVAPRLGPPGDERLTLPEAFALVGKVMENLPPGGWLDSETGHWRDADGNDRGPLLVMP